MSTQCCTDTSRGHHPAAVNQDKQPGVAIREVQNLADLPYLSGERAPGPLNLGFFKSFAHFGIVCAVLWSVLTLEHRGKHHISKRVEKLALLAYLGDCWVSNRHLPRRSKIATCVPRD